MKRTALILLMILFSALCLPITITASPSGDGTFLVALDVCSKSASFMALNADSPAIQEGPLNILHPVFSEYADVSDSVFHPSVIISAKDRPPQI